MVLTNRGHIPDLPVGRLVWASTPPNQEAQELDQDRIRGCRRGSLPDPVGMGRPSCAVSGVLSVDLDMVPPGIDLLDCSQHLPYPQQSTAATTPQEESAKTAKNYQQIYSKIFYTTSNRKNHVHIPQSFFLDK